MSITFSLLPRMATIIYWKMQIKRAWLIYPINKLAHRPYSNVHPTKHKICSSYCRYRQRYRWVVCKEKTPDNVFRGRWKHHLLTIFNATRVYKLWECAVSSWYRNTQLKFWDEKENNKLLKNEENVVEVMRHRIRKINYVHVLLDGRIQYTSGVAQR